jgi:hypothetical protein
VTIVIMASGFAYAARATALAYAAMIASPFVAHDSSSIDTFLRPARITSSQLRRGVTAAGWRSSDEVFVLPANGAMSREDVYQVYYSAGYVLYPMKVRLADRTMLQARLKSTPTSGQSSAAPGQSSPIAGQSGAVVGLDFSRASRVLVFGGPTPFNEGHVLHLGETTALVTLP